MLEEYVEKLYQRHTKTEVRQILADYAKEVLSNHTVLVDTFSAVNILEGRNIGFENGVHVRLYTAEEFMQKCNDSCVAAGMSPNMTIEKARELTKRLPNVH